MSHFTVMVIGDEPEEQLIPFQENNMGDCRKEYLKFRVFGFEADIDEWFDTESAATAAYPQLSDVSQDDVRGYWENPRAKWDWFQIGGRWAGFFKLKENALVARRGRPSWLNDNEDNYRDGTHADQALKGDIDWEGMRNEAGLRAFERWSQVRDACAGLDLSKVITWQKFLAAKDEGTLFDLVDEPVDQVCRRVGVSMLVKAKKAHPLSGEPNAPESLDWPQVVAAHRAQRLDTLPVAEYLITSFKRLLDDPGHNIDVARTLYHDQEAVKRFSESDTGSGIFSKIDDFLCSSDVYVHRARSGATSTFAVLKDGEWYEKGKLGWWACVADEKEEADWVVEHAKLLDSLPELTLLTVIDCHI